MNTMYEFGGMGSLPTESCEKDSELTSLDFSKCSTSSPSFFDSCSRGDSSSKSAQSGSRYFYPSVSSPSSSVFEFPSLDELDNMGCGLFDGYWDEDQVQSTLNSSGYGAEALNFTVGESQDVNKVFELKEPPPSNVAPTLTELNMEDSLDSLFSLKPKVAWTRKVSKPAALSMPIAQESRWKTIRDEHSGLSISPTTWNSVKNSQELSNTGLFVPKTSEVVGSSGKEKQAATDRLRPQSAVKEEQPRVDFANLFGRRSRKQNGAKPGRKPLSATIVPVVKLQDNVKREPPSPIRKCKDEPQKTNKRHTIDANDGFPNKHFHKDVEEDDDDGAESHDEGLGSENEEEHHDFNDEEDEDLADDASDISEEIAPAGETLDPGSHAGSSQVRSRRSEYDDFTPNPEKLLFIGRELQKLNNIIHDMKPTGDPSSSSRNKTRREKNKLASRACRLKKKAQHEANKLKIKALRDEYDCLSETANQVKMALKSFRENPARVDTKLLCNRLERMVDQALAKQPVAGQTDSFVNLVLDRTAQGEPTGLKLVLDDNKEDSA